MTLLRHASLCLTLCLCLWVIPPAQAQTYPTKAIRVVTGEAGGSSDFFLRGLTQELSRSLGQPAIVDNRPGGGLIPGDVVSKAAPDGYTLLFYTNNIWISPLLQKAGYDPLKDLAPITLASRAFAILVVTPSLPVKNVADVIALAKAQPGQLNYGHGSAGSLSHLTGAMFSDLTGVRMLNVPYKGSAQPLIDVMSGRLQLMFPNSAVVPPLVKSGKLRALAVTSPDRSALYPDLPAVAETVPGFTSMSVNGLMAPARTPAAIIQRLNQAALHYIKSADTREKLAAVGVEPVGSSPQEFGALIAEDIPRWVKIIKSANIRIEE